jgi:hypothetical protein
VAERHPNQRERHTLPVELRRTTVPERVRAWVARELAPVTSWRRLPGASTSAVHGLRLADGSRAVLRQWAWPWVLEDEPAVPWREVDALLLAEAHGLAAPRLLAADPTGEAAGVPSLLMSWVPGRAVAAPDLRELAAAAVRVHDVMVTDFGHTWFPWCVGALAGPPPAATRPELWERALEVRAEVPSYGSLLVHRDFHPGNVLWSRGRLGGVVDWPNACLGPWECDVATCRLNLMRWAGLPAADGFLAAYRAATGRVYDQWWDLEYLLEREADGWTSDKVAFAEPVLERVLRTR